MTIKVVLETGDDGFIVAHCPALKSCWSQGKTREEAQQINLEELFKKLGLESHLSMNRRNGFYAMAERIQTAIQSGQGNKA